MRTYGSIPVDALIPCVLSTTAPFLSLTVLRTPSERVIARTVLHSGNRDQQWHRQSKTQLRNRRRAVPSFSTTRCGRSNPLSLAQSRSGAPDFPFDVRAALSICSEPVSMEATYPFSADAANPKPFDLVNVRWTSHIGRVITQSPARSLRDAHGRSSPESQMEFRPDGGLDTTRHLDSPIIISYQTRAMNEFRDYDLKERPALTRSLAIQIAQEFGRRLRTGKPDGGRGNSSLTVPGQPHRDTGYGQNPCRKASQQLTHLRTLNV